MRQLGQGEALAQAAHQHDVRGAPGARELALVDAALVRLVGHDGQVVAGGELQHRVDLGAGGEVAGRVVRVRQDEDARARRHRGLDRGRIPRHGRHRDEHAAGALDQAAEEVARRRHDHLVAGLQQRAEEDAERVHGAVRDQELALRVGRRRERAGDRLAEGEVAAARRRDRVLVERGRHRLADVRRQGRADRALQRQHVPPGERALGRDRRHLVVPHRTTPPGRAPVWAPSAQTRSPATHTPAAPSASCSGSS